MFERFLSGAHVAAVAQGYEIPQVIAATTAVWKHMPHLMTASFLLTPQGCVHLDLLIHGKTQQGQATEATRRTIDLLVLEAFAASRGCDGPSSSQTLWHVPRWGLPAAHLLGQRLHALSRKQEPVFRLRAQSRANDCVLVSLEGITIESLRPRTHHNAPLAAENRTFRGEVHDGRNLLLAITYHGRLNVLAKTKIVWQHLRKVVATALGLLYYNRGARVRDGRVRRVSRRVRATHERCVPQCGVSTSQNDVRLACEIGGLTFGLLFSSLS